MATELAGVRRAIGDPHGRSATLHIIGVGRRRAEAGIAAVAAESPAGILAIGFCGGADPGLRTGDLHVADEFHSTDCPQPVPADPGLTARVRAWAARSQTRLAGGASVTVGSVAGADVKSALHTTAGALSVNMEDYWAARAAAGYGIPFASVRAVLDAAGDEIPAYLGASGDGIIDVLRGLAAHPGSIPSLVRLSRKAQIARNRLAHCVSGLLEVTPAPSARAAPSAP